MGGQQGPDGGQGLVSAGAAAVTPCPPDRANLKQALTTALAAATTTTTAAAGAAGSDPAAARPGRAGSWAQGTRPCASVCSTLNPKP